MNHVCDCRQGRDPCTCKGVKHVRLECDDPHCDGISCNTCNLFICAVCGCAEATLPTECPGVEVAPNVQDDIMQGKVDYKAGMWV